MTQYKVSNFKVLFFNKIIMIIKSFFTLRRTPVRMSARKIILAGLSGRAYIFPKIELLPAYKPACKSFPSFSIMGTECFYNLL